MQEKYIDTIQLLCPYGNWQHSKGMQVVDKIAGEKIRNNFMRSFARLRGLPIYVGHPDDGRKKLPLKPVGKIQSVCKTAQGIVICARYEHKIFSEIESGKLKWLSPRWQMQDLGDGLFRPIKLISAGLTNNPNIPSSGSILSLGSDLKKSLSAIGKAKIALSSIAKKIAMCTSLSTSISEEAKLLKNEKLDENIAKLNQKPQPFELATMALSLAKETGEDYATSFAKIRRKYYGTNS